MSSNDNYINVLNRAISNLEKINHSQELRINSQKEIIDELEQKLQEQENTITDNITLSNEVNRLNDIINEKNKIIAEFQNLAQVSSFKFESYINTNKLNQEALEKKNKKYEDLKSKFSLINQNNEELKKENERLLSSLDDKTNMNLNEISNLNDKLSDVKIKYNILIEETE